MAKDLTEALHALTMEAQGQTTRQDKALPAAKEATAIPPRSGASGPLGNTAGSVQSPFTETAFSGREWWPEKTMTTSDGLFTLRLKMLKEVKMLDSGNSDVVLRFKDSP